MKHGIIRAAAMCLIMVHTVPWAAKSGAGQGLGVGSWLLSPYLDISATYDSNVYKTGADEREDVFFEPEAGLRFSSSSETNLLSLRGLGHYSRREYLQETEENFGAFGDSVSILYGTPEHFTLEAIQSYRRVKESDRHASDIESSTLSAGMIQDIHTVSERRDVSQAGAGMEWRITDKTDVALRYRYCMVRYDERGFLDLEGNSTQAELAYRMTDKTAAFLSMHYGLQDQENMNGNADFAMARLGMQTRGSDKVAYKIGSGIQEYTRPEATRDSVVDAFNFEAGADWYATEKLTIRLGGHNGTQLSSIYENNGLNFISGWVGCGYRFCPETTISIRGVLRQDDYLDPVIDNGRSVDRIDQRAVGSARIDYIAPSNVLKIYAEASYDYVDSNIKAVEYDDMRVTLGLEARY